MGSLSQFEEYAGPLLLGHLSAGKGIGGIGGIETVENADYFFHNLILRWLFKFGEVRVPHNRTMLYRLRLNSRHPIFRRVCPAASIANFASRDKREPLNRYHNPACVPAMPAIIRSISGSWDIPLQFSSISSRERF